MTEFEWNTSVLGLAATNDVLMDLRSWLQTVASFDFWVFNIWPVVGSLFVDGYKGAEARDNARVANQAKHEWVLVYATDENFKVYPC